MLADLLGRDRVRYCVSKVMSLVFQFSIHTLVWGCMIRAMKDLLQLALSDTEEGLY